MTEIRFKFPDLDARVKHAKNEINLAIAAAMQTNRGMMFDAEGASNGHPKWAPLKSRDGMILSKRGNLRKSLAPLNATGKAGPDGIVRFQGDHITIGTKIAYAAMMNYGTKGLPGGVLTPKNCQALRFKIRNKWVFAKSVKIPARPFDQWSKQDEEELTETLRSKIVEVLNRANR